MDVIAAHRRTRPAKRYPISPAPCLKASAAGFAASSVTPLTTTPRTARNRKIRTIVAMIIPITELLLISFRFFSPVIPASIRRCAPEKVIYPPTVPPKSVRIAGIRFVAPASGTNVFFNALPTGGFTTMITTKITIIIMAPSTLVIVSMALLAFFSTNTRIAKRPASM